MFTMKLVKKSCFTKTFLYVRLELMFIIELLLIIETREFTVNIVKLASLLHLRCPGLEINLEWLCNVIDDNLQIWKLCSNHWNVFDC